MIFKEADDKALEIAELEGLLHNPAANAATRKRIELELRKIQAGMRGEREAAYEMMVRFGNSANWAVIHDLRIEHEGVVAQIDHLIINRFLEVWVCESKSFSERVVINEHGEFTAYYGTRPYGISSPIAQNARHMLVLQRLFNSGKVNLPSRLGVTIKPSMTSLVLVSKGAQIERPKVQFDGLDVIMKNDQFGRVMDKDLETPNLLILAKVISKETLASLASEIVSAHQPIRFDWSARFGLAGAKQTPKNDAGIGAAASTESEGKTDTVAAVSKTDSGVGKGASGQKVTCNSCSEPLPRNVASFCRFNKPRFGGKLYCIECQKTVTPA